MHPAGIKFGLSNGLLQLSGADVVLSDELLESISLEARRQIEEGERVTGTDIWNEVIGEGLGNVLASTMAPHSETTPFFMARDQIVGETLMLFAQKAGIGRKIGRDFLIDRAFWDDFGVRIKKLNLSSDMTEVRSLFFQECRNTIQTLCAGRDPDNARHADLLALFVFNELEQAGALQILERLETAKPRTNRN
jgi:hypothetical protein